MSDKYEIAKGFYTLIDKELGIHLHAPFALLPERQFFPSGALQAEVYTQKGLLHGPSSFCSEAGVLLSQSWFYEGVRQGKLRQYYASGKLYSLQRYKNGERQGKQEFYYEEGGVKTLLIYESGKLHGEIILYWPTGKIKRSSHFVHGKQEGWDRIWDEKGILVDEVEYCGGTVRSELLSEVKK